MPATPPVTIPPPAPGPGVIVAIVVAALVHVPPVIALLNVVVRPEHTEVLPVMAVAGGAITVTVAVGDPHPLEYVMTDVPPVTPVTTPPPAPGPGVTIATVAGALLQVPPVIASLNVMLNPVHTLVSPDMGPGTFVTVTIVVFVHPVKADV
jgi:hypothetical protein